MENHEPGHYYTLGHLTQFTGLTDRTLRTYLSRTGLFRVTWTSASVSDRTEM